MEAAGLYVVNRDGFTGCNIALPAISMLKLAKLNSRALAKLLVKLASC